MTIGDALLIKAVVEATGRNRVAVQAAYKNDGDLGIVACQSRTSQSTLSFGAKPKPLTARFVLEQLRQITRTTGSKSMDRKVGIIKKMMVACQGDEAKYIVRALQGKLRIGTLAPHRPPAQSLTERLIDRYDWSELIALCYVGTAAQTVLVALAHAFAYEAPARQEASGGGTGGESESDEDLHDSDEEGSPPVMSANTDGAEDTPTASADMEGDESGTGRSLEEMLALVPFKAPPEAQKLGSGRRLTREKRNELAVIAVKRAFSEYPSLTVLADALLHHPIHDIHRCCRLTPGGEI